MKKLFLLLVLIVLVTFVYLPGLNGSFYYDDFRPLGALLSVSSLESAWHYIANETSGPLGRGISMASFLLNREHWPNNQAGFFIINIAIHTLNTVLVFFISYMLAFILEAKRHRLFAAFIIAAVWGVHPLNISTNLIAVQRMAGLSGFFVLSGIALYIYGRLYESERSYLWKMAGLFVCGLMAIFSKENGVLLPVFVLVLESTLLTERKNLDSSHPYFLLFSKLTLLSLICFLLYYFVENLSHNYNGRTFDALERLYTQSLVLFDYMRSFIMPSSYHFNPFHDDYPIQYDVNIKIALAGIIHLALVAIALFKRKEWTLFSFAVLWFYAAHLLESTTVGLEMYFEHRNYLAFLGMIIAFVFGFLSLGEKYLRLTYLAFLLVIGVYTGVAYATTSVWGNSIVAANIWHNAQPASARAAEHYALLLLESGNINQALAVLNDTSGQCPNCLNIDAQILFLQCHKKNSKEIEGGVLKLSRLKDINKLQVNNTAEIYARLYEAQRSGPVCNVGYENLEKLNKAALQLPNLNTDKRLAFLFNLHNIYVQKGEDFAAAESLEAAWSLRESPLIAKLLIKRYQKIGSENKLDVFIAKVCETKKTESSFKELCVAPIIMKNEGSDGK